MAILLLVICFLGVSQALIAQKRTYNIDTTFSRWPVGQPIYYYIDSYYTATEAGLIRGAIALVSAGLGGSCVKFVETSSTDTVNFSKYKIKFTPYDSTNTLQTFCYSYPGKHNGFVNNGATEQPIYLTRGTYGCLAGPAYHDVMKYIAIVLGKRNEHQRGDRDTYITVTDANVAITNAYRKYATNEAAWPYNYDYCSITHNQPTDYAVTGTKAFVVSSAPAAIPKLDQLSNTDCTILQTIYNCPSSCPAFDCVAARQAALGTTATTCPDNKFCTGAPDESSYLTGPYSLYQSLLLFKDKCVMEYRFDFATQKLVRSTDFTKQGTATTPGTKPTDFSTYFSAPGGTSFTPPVNLAYWTVDTTTYAQSLNMDAATKQELTCGVDASKDADATTCPTAASTTAGATAALSKATSVSSQVNLGDGLMYHYIVTPSNTEIALMDGSFATTYSTTSGFLTGQSLIKTITAIQIFQDELGVNDAVLGVFGLGADGTTGYMGIVKMLLTADSALPLSPPTVNIPNHWAVQPVTMQNAVQFC